MLRRLAGRRRDEAASSLSYAGAKKLARVEDPGTRIELASRTGLRPEILYFLAEDESPDVRREIARNSETPRQADKLLATDVDNEVRCELAQKIGRLIPGLSDKESSKLQDLTFEVLRILAEDQLPRVRQIIAEEIRTATNAPPDIVQRLAEDLELIVSAPILEYSILLTDQDLLEIIASRMDTGVLSAISRRHNVSESVCDAIVAARDEPSVAALLANPSAQIREETLDSVIERAPDVEHWHEPLANRPTLSQRALQRIAGFVTAALLNVLVEKNELDAETKQVVKAAVKKRIKEEDAQRQPTVEDVEHDREDALRAKKMHVEGKLDDAAVSKAVKAGHRAFVEHALVHKTKLPLASVRRVLESKSGKAVTALAWHADLSMRTALTLQKELAQVPSHAILNARGGVDYPLSQDELSWYLDFFTG